MRPDPSRCGLNETRNGRMLRFKEYDERVRRADRDAGRRWRATMRAYARGMALAGWVAGCVLLLPALAGAATQDAKPKPAAAAATAQNAGDRKVSPYAIANKRRAEAAGAPAASTKRALGQSPMKAKPARAKRH